MRTFKKSLYATCIELYKGELPTEWNVEKNEKTTNEFAYPDAVNRYKEIFDNGTEHDIYSKNKICQ